MLFSHQLRSSIVFSDRVMTASKLKCLILNQFSFSISILLQKTGPIHTPGLSATKQPMTLANVLKEMVSLSFISSINLQIDFALSSDTETVIVKEQRINPKNKILWVGSKQDFEGCMVNPKRSKSLPASLVAKPHCSFESPRAASGSIETKYLLWTKGERDQQMNGRMDR